jgi:hypothetical protein
VDPKGNRNEALARTGLSQVQDVERLVLRLRTFLAEQRSAFLGRNQDLTPEERRVLGFPEIAPGSVGRVGGASASP